MRIAFYIAEYGDIYDKAVSIITRGPYSHCELVFSDNTWFSSSPRDGGVRFKKIDDKYGHWEYIELPPINEEVARNLAGKLCGAKYDWGGALRTILPIHPSSPTKWFCTEVCAYIVNRSGFSGVPLLVSPNALYKFFVAPLDSTARPVYIKRTGGGKTKSPPTNFPA